MTKKEYLKKLDEQVEELQAYYETIPAEDQIYRGHILGRINAYLIAKFYALELEGE